MTPLKYMCRFHISSKNSFSSYFQRFKERDGVFSFLFLLFEMLLLHQLWNIDLFIHCIVFIWRRNGFIIILSFLSLSYEMCNCTHINPLKWQMHTLYRYTYIVLCLQYCLLNCVHFSFHLDILIFTKGRRTKMKVQQEQVYKMMMIDLSFYHSHTQGYH